MEKRNLGFWEIWNMSFGFMGIQFGWGLQMANMSPIYEYLGAKPEEIPMLWLAAPLTGLVVQPIIGAWSDRTWTSLGRRKPFFLVGAILSSIALVFMPNSTALWMAAGLLWILDASINVSMEPFRAFVVDMLPEKQHSRGFAMQSFMIGIGAVVASALPWLLGNVFGVVNDPEAGGIPTTVKWSFYLGAAAFLGAVLWTVFKTKPYPPTPEELEGLRARPRLGEVLSEVFQGIAHMPATMRKVALVQFFTWPGLFLMWFYYSSAVAVDVFESAPGSPEYTSGVEFAGLTLAFYNFVTFLFALVLPRLALTLGKRWTHFLCLACGALGLISVSWVTDPNMLFVCMTGVGVAWASILSMPYAMLAPSLPPAKVGLYMGIFNFFIVLPEILASLGFGWLMEHVLDGSRMSAVVIGGGLMLLAGLLALRVPRSVDVELA
jgi:maltose/moltooligosaccharide transporter